MIETSTKPGSDVRIVTVSLNPKLSQINSSTDTRIYHQLSSVAHTIGRATDSDIKFRELEDFNHEFASDLYPEWSRYSMSNYIKCSTNPFLTNESPLAVTKLTCLLFAHELQRRLDASKIPILSIPIHPGEVHTFADRMPFPLVANVLMGIFFMRPPQGAYNSCFASASPLPKENPDFYKYQYIDPIGALGKMSTHAKNKDLAFELWETTERIVAGMDLKLPLPL